MISRLIATLFPPLTHCEAAVTIKEELKLKKEKKFK